MTEGLYFEPEDRGLPGDDPLDGEPESMPNYGQPEDSKPPEVRYVSSSDSAASGDQAS